MVHCSNGRQPLAMSCVFVDSICLQLGRFSSDLGGALRHHFGPQPLALYCPVIPDFSPWRCAQSCLVHQSDFVICGASYDSVPFVRHQTATTQVISLCPRLRTWCGQSHMEAHRDRHSYRYGAHNMLVINHRYGTRATDRENAWGQWAVVGPNDGG